MSKQPRILFYVQYLLGIGHVRRSSLIIQALCQQDVQVDVIFGGVSVDSMSFATANIHLLPAIKAADAAFSGLIKADGSELTEQDKNQRAAQLLAICETLQPDLIVTETYPFGRRQMRFELLPLLNWVQAQKRPPVLVSSIRDILQRRAPVREQECLELINTYYQKVIVHGDEQFFPLANSFPLAHNISDKINYSGYVCPTLEQPNDSNSKKSGVIVSIGGGSVGKEILQAALNLQQTGFLADQPWLLITGPNMDAADKEFFYAQSNDAVRVVEMADNFLSCLQNAYVSISMAGYNTIMDLLLTKTAAVVVPFEGSGETEQLTRSDILAEHQVLTVLRSDDMSADTLKNAINHALQSSSNTINVNKNGAQHSAQLLTDWALNRP
ncbi:glycosyltransferase [Gammaproteobacteria bacterium AS21]